MRDEIINSPKQTADLLPLYYKGKKVPQGLCYSMYIGIHPGPFASFPWDLGGSQHKQHALSMNKL